MFEDFGFGIRIRNVQLLCILNSFPYSMPLTEGNEQFSTLLIVSQQSKFSSPVRVQLGFEV
jgi:hypothetical protein